MVGLGQSLLQFGAIVSPLVAANRMETKDYVASHVGTSRERWSGCRFLAPAFIRAFS